MLLLPGADIPYTLTRSLRRRSLAVRIEEDGRVRVLAPVRLDAVVIERFLQQKSNWIYKKVVQAQTRHQYLGQRAFAEGQVFLFLGGRFKIEIHRSSVSKVQVTFDGNRWLIHLPDCEPGEGHSSQIHRRMIQWYQEQAREILGGRVWHYARIMNLQPQTISVRTQRRIWGSCDYRKKSVRLNWQIVMTPLSVIDYVVVHELCHLVIPNHSPRFWKKVAQVMPDYLERHKWLKDNALDLVLPK